MPGFHVEHFGCRAARADGEAITSQLAAVGHCAQHPAQADVVVVNTCSVTAEADRQARAFIRRTHRQNPAARIVVTGCYAQRAPRELAQIAGVAAVVGNSHKALAPAIVSSLTAAPVAEPAPSPAHPSAGAAQLIPVHSLLKSAAPGDIPIWADDNFAHSFLEDAQLVPGSQTRPNLKIQEGCGNRCTFCVIPQTRGLSRSLSAEAVLRQVNGFVAAGGNELVLSGINLGRWGRDLPTPDLRERSTLAALVRRVLAETALPRLRLSSIEPMDWDAEIIGLMAEHGGARIARHAHLPLQSGSDAVLRRMHRRYRPWHYAEQVDRLVRAIGPDLTLGADVMVGFPSESDAEFEETLALIQRLPFGYLHLFPFSPRPGTPGWALHAAQPVPAAVVAQRREGLRALAAEKTRAHRAQFAGRTLEAITLHTPAALASRRRTVGLTENFLPIEMTGQFEANRLVRVRISGMNAAGVLQSDCAAQA